MAHSQFGICEEKLAMMTTGPGNIDGATTTTVAAIHLRIRVRSHIWSTRPLEPSNGSKAELLANIEIIEDAMFPDDALKAAALQECIRSWGGEASSRPALLKRSQKRAAILAKNRDVDLMNSLIDSVLYGTAFHDRLPSFVELYKDDLHL